MILIHLKKILDFTIGHILSAYLFAKDSGEKDNAYQGKLRGVKIFLDTNFMAALLGIDGKYRKDVCLDLVKDIAKLGANICYCEISADEIDGVLDECRKSLENTTSENRIRRIRLERNGITLSQIQFLVANRESFLKGLGVMPMDFPDIGSNYSKYIDFKSLEKFIHDVYLENNPQFDSEHEKQKRRIEKDIRVISGIYRIRNYVFPKSLAQSKGIFISLNSGLAKASYLYEKERYNGGQPIINPCVTDNFIGTLIWVQQPAKIRDISTKRILAQSHAAIQPNEQLLRKYLDLITKLEKEFTITHDQYLASLSYPIALNILQMHVYNDPDSLGAKETEEIAREAFEKMKNEATRKALEEESLRKSKEGENEQIKNSLFIKSHTIGHIVAKIVNWFLSLLIIACIVLGEFKFTHHTLIQISLFIILSFIVFLHIKKDWFIDGFCKKLELLIANNVFDILLPKHLR